MTEKEQAQERIDAMKVELKKLEKIINKPDRIKVPDCIDINRSCDELRILFNDKYQSLGNFDGKYHVQVNTSRYSKADSLYLEPCKREDLKPGDVAYFSDHECGNSFSSFNKYRCILGEDDCAYISNGRDVFVRNTHWHYCWKVVK